MAAVIGGVARAGGMLLRAGSRVALNSSRASLSEKSKERMERVSFSDIKRQQLHRANMKEIERLSTDIQKELIKNMKTQILVDDIEFTGALRNSIEPGFENEFRIVSVNSPYARFVEFGTPPGIFPNFDALRLWVEQKLGITDSEESQIVTLKIGNKIKSKGIRPKRFVKKSIKMLIAKRGVKRTSPRGRRKVGKFERGLNKINKISRKVARVSKAISKYVDKAIRVRRRLK